MRLNGGLFSKRVVFTEQEAAELNELSLRIRSLLEPMGELEELLVDEVTANWFRLARCLKIDTGLFRLIPSIKERRADLEPLLPRRLNWTALAS